MSQLSLFDERPADETAARNKTAAHIPKAFYSATADPSRVACWRCKATIERKDIKAHTAACWPEAGKPWKVQP